MGTQIEFFPRVGTSLGVGTSFGHPFDGSDLPKPKVGKLVRPYLGGRILYMKVGQARHIYQIHPNQVVSVAWVPERGPSLWDRLVYEEFLL